MSHHARVAPGSDKANQLTWHDGRLGLFGMTRLVWIPRPGDQTGRLERAMVIVREQSRAAGGDAARGLRRRGRRCCARRRDRRPRARADRWRRVQPLAWASCSWSRGPSGPAARGSARRKCRRTSSAASATLDRLLTRWTSRRTRSRARGGYDALEVDRRRRRALRREGTLVLFNQRFAEQWSVLKDPRRAGIGRGRSPALAERPHVQRDNTVGLARGLLRRRHELKRIGERWLPVRPGARDGGRVVLQ